MIIQIDTNTDVLYYDQLVQLEGTEYLFQFLWADRESAWYLNIYDNDGNPIALCIKLVVNWPLLRRFKTSTTIPPGTLWLGDLSGQGLDIQTSDELGARCPLFYVTSDDTDLQAAT